jgi:trigger factor
MQVSKINEDGLTHQFSVVLAAEELNGRVEAKLVEMQGQVQLKGFRPGKVPMGHLKRTFGRSVLGEVIETAVTESSEQACRDASLVPATPPKIQITKFEDGGDLEFSMTVDVMPPIPALDARAVKVERLVVDISDEDTDRAIDQLAKSNRSFEDRADDEAAETGDAVVIDFAGSVDGVAFDGGTAEGQTLELGSGQFIPGFEEQLIGAKKGDSLDVHVTFPATYGVDALAGKAAVFAVTVHQVRKPIEAVRDDEFAKRFGFETMEALREAARAQAGQEMKQVSRTRLKRALLDQLDTMFDFPLPPSLVEAEFDMIWKQVMPETGTEGAEDIEAPTDEDKAEFRKIAERRVRLGLLLAEVGRINNVQIAQEDLNRAVVEQAKRYPGQERQVFEYYNKNPQAIAELRAPLFEEKVVDFILELADVTERVVSRDELLADPDEEAAA